MDEETLDTFLHISDLHIGDFGPNGSAVTQAHWGRCRIFEGFLGHHHRALRALDNLYLRLRKDENAKLVVTGDLTACGKHDQFRDAALYLGARLPHLKGGCGLEAPNWATAGIPGNHDHWPGTNNVVGPPTNGLPMTFPQMPFVKTLAPLRSGHAITFVFINTDADVTPNSLSRRLAQGRFISELDKLDAILQAPLPFEVRVLVLHHSRSYGFNQLSRQRLCMTRNSWRALNQFISDKNIRVLMCGHIHWQHITLDSLRGMDGAPVTFLDCRCGTTTVRNTIPYHWRGALGNFPVWNLPPNTAIVHRVVRDAEGDVFWKAQDYILGSSGFAPVPRGVHVLRL
jgi:Calcineurin-like phosphoesterase